MRSVGDVEDMAFGERFNERVQNVTSPNSVVCMDLGVAFDKELEDVHWSAHLHKLSSGCISTMRWGEESAWPL